MNILFSIITVVFTALSVFIAYLAFRNNITKDQKKNWINEGSMISDIGYIKACVERMEKNLCLVEDRYQNISERLVKLEEGLSNVNKRIDTL